MRSQCSADCIKVIACRWGHRMPPLALTPAFPPLAFTDDAQELKWYQEETRLLASDCEYHVQKHHDLAGTNRRFNVLLSFVIWFVSTIMSAPLATYVLQQDTKSGKPWAITTLVCSLLVSILYGVQTKAKYRQTIGRLSSSMSRPSSHTTDTSKV